MPYNPDIADRVRNALRKHTNFTECQMFGGVAFMVNGNMCAGVNGEDVVLRLGDGQASSALAEPHTRQMDFTGRPLKSMIYLEPLGYQGDAELDAWLLRGMAFIRTLPSK